MNLCLDSILCSPAPFVPSRSYIKLCQIQRTRQVYALDYPASCRIVGLLTRCKESSDSDEHFSDAHSGLGDSGTASPVRPLTKLPKVEPQPGNPDLPKTHINEAQRSDAEREEGAIIPASNSLESHADSKTLTHSSTVGERVESSSSRSAISEVTTHEQRFDNTMRDIADESSTKVIQVDSAHSEKTKENNLAEEAKDAPGRVLKHILWSELIRSGPLSSPGIKPGATRTRRTSSSASRGAMREKTNDLEDDEGAFGDDFDDFEEGAEAADFDDFEGGFQEAEPPAQAQPIPAFAYVRSHIVSLTRP